jgi:hypothetical protein
MRQPSTPSSTRLHEWFPVIGSALLLVNPFLDLKPDVHAVVDASGHFLVWLYYLFPLVGAQLYSSTWHSDAPEESNENMDEKLG